MPAFTAHLNLYLPGGGSLGIGGDDEEADVDKINQNMQALDAWSVTTDTRLTSLEPQLQRNQQYRGTAGGISSVIDMRMGDTYRETDGEKRRKIYDGANWNGDENGVLIRPTAVVGGTVGADGSIDFTAVASVSLDGVFTAKYREYEVRYRVSNKPTNQGVALRLRAGGTDNSAAASYFFTRGGTSGSGYIENRSTLDRLEPDFSPYVNLTKNLRLLSPQAAAFTNMWSVGGVESNNAGLMTTCLAASGQHQVASAFDGITLYLVSGGAMTGNLVVVGYP